MPPARTTPSTSAPASKPVSPVNHLHLFFNDGDISLLSALDSKAKRQTRFKVHQSILSLHSSVFADMFDSSTGSKGATVQLDESASAIESLLSYIYNGTAEYSGTAGIRTPTFTSLCTRKQSTSDSYLQAVIEVLLAADKYDVRNLQVFLGDGLQ